MKVNNMMLLIGLYFFHSGMSIGFPDSLGQLLINIVFMLSCYLIAFSFKEEKLGEGEKK